MQAPPPTTRRRSALTRYAPFIAVAVVIALVVVIVGGRGNNKSKQKVKTENTKGSTRVLPITYNEAKAAGTLAKYKWGANCDTTTGNVAIPVLAAAPCVPAFSGSNGGATGAPGVTANSINIVFYVPKPDPQFDILAKKIGAYDSPEQQIQNVRDFFAIFSGLYETYGRKINLQLLHGTGTSSDPTAARADAIKAAVEMHAFAVINGPSQTNAFAEELTSRGVMCVGACLIAQPQSFYAAHPGLFGVGPLPEQPADATIELIKKQLNGKNAVYAGDPKFKTQPRKFALLTYDTPDSQFKPVWDQFEKGLKAAGIPLVTHVTYFLDLTKTQEDSRTIVTKLKASGATSVIFSGDPIEPIYFTQEATRQNYRPEWIMSGTVYADTDVFARSFDQSQWAHAFGIGIVGAQLPEKDHDDYQVHEWWFGKPPVGLNTSGIIGGDSDLLFTGIQLAGPTLNETNFRDGLWAAELPPESPNGLRAIFSYGKHGLWAGTDYGGLDNLNLIWYDPTAKGPDETGTEGTGSYRFVDNARRWLPGHYPSAPVNFFDPTNTITRFVTTPPELQPKQYPKPTH